VKKERVVLLCVIILAASFGQAASRASKERLWPDNLFGVDFVSPSVGYVSGYAGSLLRTRDGGQTWEWSQVGVDELLRRVVFVNETQGWVVGHRGTILHTDNGGNSWHVQHRVPGIYLRDIAFADSKHGWAVGHEATILHTDDGGMTWHPQSLIGYKGRDLPRLHGVTAINAQRAVLVGEFGVVAITNNGGATWFVQKTGTNKTLLDVSDSDDDAFVAAGVDGVLLSIDIKPEVEKSNSDNPVVITAIIESHTVEPFFAITRWGKGRTLVAGRSVVALIDNGEVTHLAPDSSIQLPFAWYGGVDVDGEDRFWLVGVRGAIASGSLSEGGFSRAGGLGVSDNVIIAPKEVLQ